MDKINFTEFTVNGVLGTDTFEIWRQKTNGIIYTLDTINTSYASKSEVLRLDNTTQSVGPNKYFNGLTIIGPDSSSVPLTVNSSSQLYLTNSILVDGDKFVSAYSLETRSGKLKANGKEYTFPAAPNQGDGYIYNHAGALEFKSVSSIAAQVLADIGDSQLISPAQEITPVGAIVGLKRSTPPNDSWLKCDGGTFVQTTYPDLYTALGNTTTLPNLANKVLIGATGSTGFISGATGAGTSYYEVTYYIKAKADPVANFTISAGNGISLIGQNSSTQLNIYGGTVSLKTGNEFAFDNTGLTLATNSVSRFKLKDASTAVTTGIIGIPLRDSLGYIRGNTPDAPLNESNSTILVNKAYADTIGQAKEHKIRTLNGQGYNSYAVQPDSGCVFVTYDSKAKVYGLTNSLYYGQRYGANQTQSFGYSLPRFDKTVSKIYTDTFNTYVKYSDNTVDSYGYNTNRKSGSTLSTATADRLSTPTPAFNGDTIDEVILSYDTNAQTVYARNTNGKLWVAGNNTYGQLGLNVSTASTSDAFLPRLSEVGGLEASGGKTISKAWLIGGGTTQTGYALASDGSLWACGYGTYGQIGRRTSDGINRSWLPVLSDESSAYAGATPTYVSGTGVYTSANHGLKNHDLVIDGISKYFVKFIADNQFSLYTSEDLLSGLRTGTAITFSTCTIYKRMTGIVNAYFGGTGNQTFAYAQITDGTLYSWGYGLQGQLGKGSNVAINSSLSKVPITSSTGPNAVKAASAYTGLDNTVHFIGTNGFLYACGDNSSGQLGIGKTITLTSKENEFKRIEFSNLDESGLNLSGNTAYSVHKFFSVGTNSRFCVFTVGASKKLTAWGDNANGKLGTGGSATAYSKPQNVYCENDEYVSDIQSTSIFGANNICTFLIKDSNQSYGDMFTCGYHSYNIGNVPDSTIPFITKAKNI